MITKFVLIIWIGIGQNQVLSTETFDTLEECNAVATAIKSEMDRAGLYRCVPYTFDRR